MEDLSVPGKSFICSSTHSVCQALHQQALQTKNQNGESEFSDFLSQGCLERVDVDSLNRPDNWNIRFPGAHVEHSTTDKQHQPTNARSNARDHRRVVLVGVGASALRADHATAVAFLALEGIVDLHLRGVARVGDHAGDAWHLRKRLLVEDRLLSSLEDQHHLGCGCGRAVGVEQRSQAPASF
eukprot:3000929-Rhodomonas_salina.1